MAWHTAAPNSRFWKLCPLSPVAFRMPSTQLLVSSNCSRRNGKRAAGPPARRPCVAPRRVRLALRIGRPGLIGLPRARTEHLHMLDPALLQVGMQRLVIVALRMDVAVRRRQLGLVGRRRRRLLVTWTFIAPSPSGGRREPGGIYRLSRHRRIAGRKCPSVRRHHRLLTRDQAVASRL